MLVNVNTGDSYFGYHSLRRWLPQRLAELVKNRKPFIVNMAKDGYINKFEIFVGFKPDEPPCDSYTIVDGLRNLKGQFYPAAKGYYLEFPAGTREMFFDRLDKLIEFVLLGCRG